MEDENILKCCNPCMEKYHITLSKVVLISTGRSKIKLHRINAIVSSLTEKKINHEILSYSFIINQEVVFTHEVPHKFSRLWNWLSRLITSIKIMIIINANLNNF
ncbi:hypothetical protein RF11_08481 [Thelohanellus kitauei]|uniref:Uncharacterized protein n=1 Tax=Thelohanellus kitauei TaxID=669202 RepID=A0A0C2JXC0_THEKT|nr:hypothetical protein RF11_08481 [Thelohanellus kitauei]